MADLTDFDNPSFVMLPFPTDRTAWLPFGIPMIVVIPHVRDADGNLLPNADLIYNDQAGLTIYVANVDSTIAPVAGPDHRGIFNPDINLYSINVPAADLFSRKITNITPGSDGKFTFTSRAGIIGSLTYLAHADYYDISDIKLDIEQLPPNRYVLVYQLQFYFRTVSDTGRLVCFDTSMVSIVRSRFGFNHPGDVLLQMVQSTPALYFNNVTRSQDTTVAFYRPFSEIFQDIHDEQAYLEKLNWVFEIRPEHVPYLGFLLGWDLPYFPETVDNLRRAVLRNMVRLQRLKGTKRAVRELFDLFGFVVDIGNIWWTPDGKKYVGAGEDAANPVTLTPTATYEPLLLDYSINGYGAVTIPLINRPSIKTAVIESFLVTRGSQAEVDLQTVKGILEDDVDAIQDTNSLIIIDRAWIDIPHTTAGIVGYSRLNVDESGISSLAAQFGWPVHGPSTAKFDYRSNVLTLSCSRYVQYDVDNLTLYTFISYQFDKLTVAPAMAHLQSNRFDIEILNKTGDAVRSDILNFLVEFLFQIKAFHSLLRKILYTITITDVYQVTDYCVGGLITQDPNKDAGRQQVPPEAIIPHIGSEQCEQLDPQLMGYRPQDIKYRIAVLTELNVEFEAWKALGSNCDHTPRGQDRITDPPSQDTGAANGEMIFSQPARSSLCNLDGSDYCYKGRVNDTLGVHEVLTSIDTWQFRICGLHLGTGLYFTLPTSPNRASQADRVRGGLLGKYLSEFKSGPNALHYSNQSLNSTTIDPHRFEAFQRPSLQIEKDNLCFPGHRLPTLGKLTNDYISGIWDQRPWDYNAICACPPYLPNPLNAKIEIDTNGDERLVFDYRPYTITGNNLIPDISSLGNHSSPTTDGSEVVHSVYIAKATGHPAIQLDNTVGEIGIITTNDPIFQSAGKCNGQYQDYSQGYPATSGWLNINAYAECTDPVDSAGIFKPVCYFPNITDRTEAEIIREGLGLPASQSTPTLLYTLSSEVRVPLANTEYDLYTGYRLDCGCTKLICDSNGATPSSVLGCTISQFMDDYGDLEPDQVSVISVPTLTEQIGADTVQLNGQSPSLFDLRQIIVNSSSQISEKGHQQTDPFPPSGSFTYKDSYDVIYEIMWDIIPDKTRPVIYVDFVTIKKEPRQAGLSDHMGQIKNKQIFYNGTISTIRQLYAKSATSAQLVALGEEQIFDAYQGSFLCNNHFIDPFVTHLDNSIIDSIDGLITSGPHWGDPSFGDSSEDTMWVDPGTADGLKWIDVFA